jgi:hypothetical protein
MSRFIRKLTILAALAGIVALGATTARADDVILTLNISDAGGSASGTWNVTALTPVSVSTSGTTSGVTFVGSVGSSSSSLSFGGTVGGVELDFAVTGASNSPGTLALSYLNLSSNTITNNNTSDATLSIATSATGYTQPTGSVIGNFATSGVLTNGTLTNGSFIGSADGYNPTQLTFAASGSAQSLAFSDPATLLTGFPNITPFTASETIQVTLAPGTITSTLAGTLTLTPTPEPASVGMAATAIVAFAGYAVRRRMKKS